MDNGFGGVLAGTGEAFQLSGKSLLIGGFVGLRGIEHGVTESFGARVIWVQDLDALQDSFA
jgi:hypothetical protein